MSVHVNRIGCNRDCNFLVAKKSNLRQPALRQDQFLIFGFQARLNKFRGTIMLMADTLWEDNQSMWQIEKGMLEIQFNVGD